MIERDTYLNKLIKTKDQDFVKIITGVRRCGKSSLLILFKEYLLEQKVDKSHIIDLNYEKFIVQKLNSMEKLHEYLDHLIVDQERYYILIDEVQEIDEWAKVMNSVRSSYNCDLYITGSNSHMFSGEHLTYLSGRYIQLNMFPLSFKEFLRFRKYSLSDNLNQSFQEYLTIGSFPAISLTSNSYLVETITSGLFDSIFIRDVLLRGKIKDEGAFYKIAKFVFENIGNTMSANSIANTMKSSGHRITSDTVDNYLKLMCNAYLIYQCERYDIRGKQRLATNGKYYVVDSGLRNYLLGQRPGNLGHLLENIIYLELLRRGYEVSVGKNQNYEVDFIAVKDSTPTYIQVSLSIMDENTREREIRALQTIKDSYEKIILTMDTIDLSYQGIKHINILTFLME